MKFQILLLIIISSIDFIRGQIKYELVFFDEEVVVPCEKYPDNFVDQLLDMNNMNFGKTEDGSMEVNGYISVVRSVKTPLPFLLELYKKERGTWQPTTFNQKREDTCTACFSTTEIWHGYLKSTPKEQLTCPFTVGQRVDFNLSGQTYVSLPFRIPEGEYRANIHVGSNYDDLFICVDIFATLYRI